MTSEHGESTSDADLLKGWKDIAQHLRASDRTVQRWEALRGLPIRRVGIGASAVIYASRRELDAWLSNPDQQAHVDGDAAGEAPGAGALDDPGADAAPVTPSGLRGRTWLSLGLLALVVTAVGVGVAFRAMRGSGQSAVPAQAAVTLQTAVGVGASVTAVFRVTCQDGFRAQVDVPIGGTASIGVGGHAYVFSSLAMGSGVRVEVSTLTPNNRAGYPELRGLAMLDAAVGRPVATPQLSGIATIELLRTVSFTSPQPVNVAGVR